MRYRSSCWNALLHIGNKSFNCFIWEFWGQEVWPVSWVEGKGCYLEGFFNIRQIIEKVTFRVSENKVESDFRSVWLLVSEQVHHPDSALAFDKHAVVGSCKSERGDSTALLNKFSFISDWDRLRIDNFKPSVLRNWISGGKADIVNSFNLEVLRCLGNRCSRRINECWDHVGYQQIAWIFSYFLVSAACPVCLHRRAWDHWRSVFNVVENKRYERADFGARVGQRNYNSPFFRSALDWSNTSYRFACWLFRCLNCAREHQVEEVSILHWDGCLELDVEIRQSSIGGVSLRNLHEIKLTRFAHLNVVYCSCSNIVVLIVVGSKLDDIRWFEWPWVSYTSKTHLNWTIWNFCICFHFEVVLSIQTTWLKSRIWALESIERVVDEFNLVWKGNDESSTFRDIVSESKENCVNCAFKVALIIVTKSLLSSSERNASLLSHEVWWKSAPINVEVLKTLQILDLCLHSERACVLNWLLVVCSRYRKFKQSAWRNVSHVAVSYWVALSFVAPRIVGCWCDLWRKHVAIKILGIGWSPSVSFHFLWHHHHDARVKLTVLGWQLVLDAELDVVRGSYLNEVD